MRIKILEVNLVKVDDQWILELLSNSGVFAQLKKIVGDDYKKIIGEILGAVNGWATAQLMAEHLKAIPITEEDLKKLGIDPEKLDENEE